jgi:NAD(P)-dependent dehydrogenase (short-subunit alcohol dehydrogenase family)
MTDQRPIGSGFGPASTAGEVVTGHDLSGKVAIVTGGSSGLGLAAARALSEAGAEVVVPARDRTQAGSALACAPEVEVDGLDLMDPASIHGFADRFLASKRPLHMLINSAGVMAPPLLRDARGYESQFSTNHLGHFLLAARLWPALATAHGARVVAVSSRAHARAPADLEDPNFEHNEYEAGLAYAQSKSANALFALELDRRGRDAGVRAFSVHPGGIVTNLGRYTSPELMRHFGMIDEAGRPIIDPSTDRKTPEQGAATMVWCATSPQLAGMGGVYCEDCDIAPPLPADVPWGPGVRPWGADAEAAGRLWTLSERLTGASFL